VVDDGHIVQCGHCGARYRVQERVLGRRCRCKRCRHVFRLTPKASLDDTVMDWLEEDGDAKTAEKDGSPSTA